jgi:hypothetical protein
MREPIRWQALRHSQLLTACPADPLPEPPGLDRNHTLPNYSIARNNIHGAAMVYSMPPLIQKSEAVRAGRSSSRPDIV